MKEQEECILFAQSEPSLPNEAASKEQLGLNLAYLNCSHPE